MNAYLVVAIRWEDADGHSGGAPSYPITAAICATLVEALAVIEKSKPRLNDFTALEVHQWETDRIVNRFPIVPFKFKEEKPELEAPKLDLDGELRNFLEQYDDLDSVGLEGGVS